MGDASPSLLRYLLRRLLQAVPLVFGVLVLCFVLIQLAPGDPIYVLASEGGDEASYAEMRARHGLDARSPSSSGAISWRCCEATSATLSATSSWSST